MPISEIKSRMGNKTSSRVIIFGATGGTGRELVHQALEAGLHVTAFVRQPSLDPHERLSVVTGNVLDQNALKNSIDGQDAVLCALGAPPKDDSGIRTQGTRNIIVAMTATGVRRLMCVSSFGVGETRALLPFFMRKFVVPYTLKRAFEDHENQETLIKRSGLDWTIVRPPRLTRGQAKGQPQHSASGGRPPSMKVTRADVARFMIEHLDSSRYIRKSPYVSER